MGYELPLKRLIARLDIKGQNVIKGIQPITKYRKKEFGTTLSTKLIALLNAQIRLS